MPLFPPLHFQFVEEGVYRSAFPTDINYCFLQGLGLKTIVILDDQCPLSLQGFIEDFDINAIYVDNNSHDQLLSKWNSSIGEEMVITALKVLIHVRHHPVLVTCKHGKTLTGSVIACLRKLQGWSLISIFEEYRRFAGYKPQQKHEEFIELFDTDLVTEEDETATFLKKTRELGLY